MLFSKRLALSLLALIITCGFTFGQSTQSGIQKTFEFDQDSRASEFSIDISEETYLLEFHLDGFIYQGDLKVSLFNPAGERKGGFQLKSEPPSKVGVKEKPDSKTHSYTVKSDMASETKGNMNKKVHNPERGSWKVKINPHNVKGKLLVSIARSSRD